LPPINASLRRDRREIFPTHGGLDGEVYGIERFGASAPYKDLQKALWFLPEDVVKRAEWLLGR
jgi:transketolase